MFPAIVNIAIARENARPFRLWLPVIILWPVLLLCIIIIAPLALFAEIFLSRTGVRPFALLIASLQVLVCLRGITVDVVSKSGNGHNFNFTII
jgi:hypothetical protein